jgi:predicted aspartyl protease
MGKVWEDAEIINEHDQSDARAGKLPADKVRKVQLKALVDTGTTLLVLPEELIKALGLEFQRTVQSRMADGKLHKRTIWGPVKLRVHRREAIVEVMAAPPGVPALIGQIPLEGLDLLVDSRRQCLVPNPESPDPEMALMDVF